MSYYLLAIELLLACMLFAAFWIIVGLRSKRRILSVLVWLAGLLLPLIPLGLLLIYAVAMRVAAGVRSPTLSWAIILLGVYLAGAITIRVFAGRRDTAGIRRAHRWPPLRIATSFSVVITLMGMTLWNLNLQARIDAQALRAEAGSLALSVIPPQVADSVNAAPLYQQADVSFKELAIDADKVDDRDFSYAGLNEPSPKVTAYLQRQEKTLELLRRAADLPDCRPDFDYLRPDITVLINKLGPWRTASNLLGTAARTEAATGNIELALDDCRRMYVVGSHSGAVPLLLSRLVTIAIDANASRSVAQVLPFVTKKDQLDHLPAADPAALSRGFERTLRGEEVYVMANYCDLAEGKSSVTAPSVSSGPDFAGGVAMWVLWAQDDVGFARDALHRLQQISLRPFYQTAAERKQLLEETQPGKRRGVMTAVLLPSLLKTLETLAESQALRSAVGVAVASTRYRLDHGQYPDRAELLMPGYLEAIPLDPMDGKPLRLKRSEDGSLTIYSIGADGIDNGGNVERTNDRRPEDAGIILRLPPAR